MSYQELLELVVDLMVKRDRWEWRESDDEFTHQDAQALRHMNWILLLKTAAAKAMYYQMISILMIFLL